MITRNFSKSKPINYLLVFALALFSWFIAVFKYNQAPLNVPNVLQLSANFILVYLGLFITNYIVKKSSLTDDNNYVPLIYVILLLFVPQIFLSTNWAISSVFFLLALRRIINMASGQRIEQKLFDAGVLVSIAVLFKVWTCFAVLLVFFAIIKYTIGGLKQWLAFLLGSFSVVLIYIALQYVLTLPEWSVSVLSSYSFSLQSYNSLQFISVFTTVLVLGLWTVFNYVNAINSKKRVYRTGYYVVLYAFLFAFIMILLVPNKWGVEWVFICAPFSVIVANYFQTQKGKWFKELLLWTLLALSILVHFL